MPTEAIIVVAGITLAFTVFALTLAWADYHTRDMGRPDAAE